MTIASLISPESVIAGLKGNSKKQILQDLSGHVARIAGINDRLIFETLLQRERLGTTGIGQGIAIPHGRIAGLNGWLAFLRSSRGRWISRPRWRAGGSGVCLAGSGRGRR